MTCKRPHIGIGVFIMDEQGKLLLQRRRGSHGEGTWSLPGGKLEAGETWEDCAKRETKEEVCLDINDVTFVAATNDVFSRDLHYVTLFVKAGKHKGKPRIGEPHKCTDIGWFGWDELPQPLFLPLENLRKQGFHP
ncbi:NUDIX domain-containing protein [Candidatus Woesearchaeota archaeon]|nr:NUDIX domain-containing protein [Candidatus Woesearchaeota archaeon]